MTSRHRLRPALFLPVLLIGFTLPAAAAPLVPRIQSLGNGLQLVLLEDHSSPLVAESVWVHVGGRDESKELEGYSHFLEHLIPQGTAKRAPRQQQMEIFRAGGVASSQADYDRTFLFTLVESSAQDLAMEGLFQQVSQAVLPESGIQRIRPIVSRELKDLYADPRSVLFLEQMLAAFPNQPYRVPYYGSFAGLEKIKHTTVEPFYTNFYVPNNMVLVVAGDIQPDRVLQKAKSLFGALRPNRVLPPHPKFEAGFTGPDQTIKKLERMGPSVSLLFSTPGYRHPDRWALEVLARLCANPGTSPLMKDLIGMGKPAILFNSDFHLQEERGLFIVNAVPISVPGLAETGRAMAASLARIRKEGFPEEAVKRTVKGMRLAEAVRRDNVGVVAQALAEAALFGDVRYGWEADANLAKVEVEDLKRVLATYLTAENAKTLLVLPKEETSPLLADLDSLSVAVAELRSEEPIPPDFAKTLYVADKAPLSPRPERRPAQPATRIALPSGLRVLVKPDRGRGLVAASLLIRAGFAFDPPGKEGLAQVVASHLSLGSRSVPPKDFLKRADAIGSTFGVAATVETVEAGLTVFPEDLPEALALLASPVRDPAFAADQLGTIRSRIRRFTDGRSRSSIDTARDLVRERIFRGHPYGQSFAGSEDSLGRITVEDVAAFHRRYYRPDRAVLTLAGDVDPAEVKKLAADAFSGWVAPAGEEAPPELPEWNGTEVQPGEFSRVVDASPAEVILAFPGVRLADPDFPLLRALCSLLSARGVLDLVLDQSMATSVRGVPEGLTRGGLLSVEASAAPSAAARVAYELMLRARALGVKEVTPATIADLLAIERGRLLREQEGVYTLASNLGFYELIGPGFTTYDSGKSILPNLTPAQLREGAERFLDASRLVRVSAGPRAN